MPTRPADQTAGMPGSAAPNSLAQVPRVPMGLLSAPHTTGYQQHYLPHAHLAGVARERLSDGAPDTPQAQQHHHHQQQQQQQHNHHDMPRSMGSVAAGRTPTPVATGPLREQQAPPTYPRQAVLRPQGEVVFAHLHCQFGSAWADIARHMHSTCRCSPDALAKLWQSVSQTGTGCGRLLADYSYSVKQGLKPAAAFAAVVQALPAGARLQLLEGAVNERELEQLQAALLTAADPDAANGLLDQAREGRVGPPVPHAGGQAAAAAAHDRRLQEPAAQQAMGAGGAYGQAQAQAGNAQLLLVAQAAVRAMARHTGAPEGQDQLGTNSAAAAGGHAGHALQAQNASVAARAAAAGGSQEAMLQQQPAEFCGVHASPYAAPADLDCAALTRARQAAEAYHTQSTGRRQSRLAKGSSPTGWAQQQQQQQQEGQPRQTAKLQTQNTYPAQHAQQQGLQQQQQQIEAKTPETSSQPQMTYEQLTASLVSMVRNGLPPAAAARMLQQLQPYYQQSANKPSSSRLAAAPAPGQGCSNMQAGGISSGVVQQDMRAGSNSVNVAVVCAGRRAPGVGANPGVVQPVPPAVCFPNLPQQLLPRPVNVAAQQQPQQQHIPTQLLSHAQRQQQHSVLPPQKQQQQQQQVQEPSHHSQQQQQQVKQQPRQSEHRQDIAGVADGLGDHVALLQHINGLEEAVRKLNGRNCSLPNSSPKQQGGDVPGNVDMQSPASAKPAAAPGPSSAQQPVAPVRDRRLQAIKDQLERAADRTQVIKDIKDKAYVDLDGLLRRTSDTGSLSGAVTGQRRSSGDGFVSTPTHPKFAQATKQNENALLADAAEAVLAKREPHVRAAVAQYGGTRRVISAADLQSTNLGKQVLAVLQRLLLIPRGDMPEGAQIVLEVALPEPGHAPAACAAQASPAAAAAAVLVNAAAPQQVPAAALPLSIDLTLDDEDPHGGEMNAGMKSPSAGAAPSAAVSPVAATVAAAATAALTEDLGGVLDQPMPAGFSSNASGSNAGTAAVVAMHADTRLHAAMPFEKILAALTAGSKRSRTEQQQHGNAPVVCEPDEPPAKRTYRAELYL